MTDDTATPSSPRAKAFLAAICVVAAVASFAVGWFHILFSPRTFSGDWTYFDPLSLVIRSSVLHYGVFPMHDPWVGGGMDLLANPQSRVLSPQVLWDLLLRPQLANIASMTLYGALGIWGGVRLLRLLGASTPIALSGALVFINSTWFGLHYAEGHVVYGCVQLFPWVLYFALTLDRAPSVFWLLSLQALFILDGAIYALVWSLFLVGGCVVTGLSKPWRHLQRPSAPDLGLVALALAAAGLLMATKAIPVLGFFRERPPSLDFTSIPIDWLARFLFTPLQDPLDKTMHPIYRFHEFGCYLGILGLLILAAALLTRGFARRHVAFLVLAAFWFWVGSGWGGSANPWNLFQKVPIFNSVHLQSRLFILMHLFLLVPMFLGLEHFARRWHWKRAHLALCALLVVESFVVRNYPFQRAYEHWTEPRFPSSVLTWTTITRTVPYGAKPMHYFTGAGAVRAYDAFSPPTRVRASDAPDYRGEIFTLVGQGTARLEAYTPGSITLTASAATPIRVGVNTNWLSGWKVVEGPGTAYANYEGLVAIELPAGESRSVVRYSPDYWPLVLTCYIAGLGLWVVGFMLARSRRHRIPAAP
jgi:hypothetical protein